MRHSICSTLVAAGDTVRTSLGTITLPALAKKLVAFWFYQHSPGVTTLVGQSGIVEFECPDRNILPQQYPQDSIAPLADGGITQPKFYPVEIDNIGSARVTAYVTMDMAVTVANAFRWGMIYED